MADPVEVALLVKKFIYKNALCHYEPYMNSNLV